MRSIAWKFVIGAAAVVGLAASVVAASVRKGPDAAEAIAGDAPQASEEPARLAMLETTAPAKPAPVDVLQPTEPNIDDGKPIMLLGLEGWESQNMEQPFVNMARMLGNSWGAGQNWPGNESMDMSALWKGGFIDPDTMLPKAVPPGMDYVRTGLLRAGARYDPEGYAGTYVVEWEGDAKARAGLTCAGNQKFINAHRIEFTCSKSDKDWTNVQFFDLKNGGLKALRIFKKSDEAQIRAGQEFSNQFLDYARQYKVLRTMDIQASVVAAARSVDQLGKKSQSQWTADPRVNYDGLPMGPPMEVLFDMAVAADSALWMNVSGPIGAPARFDEIVVGGARHRENFEQKLQMQWVEEDAETILASPEWDKYADEVVRSLIASGYPETRALYIETANEVWNNANPFWWCRDYFLGFYNWLNKRKKVDGYGAMVGVGYMEGRFAVALDRALENAGRKQAVVFVLAAQHANPATSEGAILGFKRYFEDAKIDPAPYLARAGLSTATYFHEGTSRQGLFPASSDDELKAKWLAAIKSDPQGTAKALTDWYLGVTRQASIPYLVRMRKEQEAVAAKHGVRFIGDYEGESHDAVWEPLRNDPDFIKWYFDVWMDGPEGERLTREWANALFAENPNAMIANYKGVCPREIKYPWCDGIYGEETGRRRALKEFLRQ
ncbi:MAG: hypothetical protein R3C54_02070 [Parvularculaceae bacterium]